MIMDRGMYSGLLNAINLLAGSPKVSSQKNGFKIPLTLFIIRSIKVGSSDLCPGFR